MVSTVAFLCLAISLRRERHQLRQTNDSVEAELQHLLDTVAQQKRSNDELTEHLARASRERATANVEVNRISQPQLALEPVGSAYNAGLLKIVYSLRIRGTSCSDATITRNGIPFAYYPVLTSSAPLELEFIFASPAEIENQEIGVRYIDVRGNRRT